MKLGPSAVNASVGERLINSLADDFEVPIPMSYVPDGMSFMSSLFSVANKTDRLLGTAAVIVMEKIESVTEGEE